MTDRASVPSLVGALAKTPVFARCPREILERLAGASTTRTLERKEKLFVAGARPSSLCVLRSGLVKVERTQPDGRTLICGLFGAPESVGDMPLVSNSVYPATAIACTSSLEVILVPREAFLVEFTRDPFLLASFLETAQEKMRFLLAKITTLSAGSVDARLASLLLHLHARFGDELDDGSYSIPIYLSRQELAELVASSTETVIRTLGRWENDGLLSSNRRGFSLLNPKRLSELSGVH